MPAPKTPREQFDELLESTPGAEGVARWIVRAARARGFAVADPAEKARAREFAANLERFVYSADGKEVLGKSGKLTFDGLEAARQATTAFCIELENAKQDLTDLEPTPIEAVAAQRKKSGIYAF